MLMCGGLNSEYGLLPHLCRLEPFAAYCERAFRSSLSRGGSPTLPEHAAPTPPDVARLPEPTRLPLDPTNFLWGSDQVTERARTNEQRPDGR